MTAPTVTTPPDLPLRSEASSNAAYVALVEAFLSYLPTFADDLNAFSPALAAAAAAAAPMGTSTTSNTVAGTGSLSFTMESGRMLTGGQYVVIADAAAPITNYMWGIIESYNFSTGALVFTSLSSWGSGTFTSWLIGLSGPQGPEGGSMLTSPTITGTLTQDSYTITDGASVVLDPANGSIQTWTLGANRTPTDSLTDGQSMLLLVNDGAAYSITWSSISVTWKTDAGAAPTLNTSGFTLIVLTQVGGVVYGARVGDA